MIVRNSRDHSFFTIDRENSRELYNYFPNNKYIYIHNITPYTQLHIHLHNNTTHTHTAVKTAWEAAVSSNSTLKNYWDNISRLITYLNKSNSPIRISKNTRWSYLFELFFKLWHNHKQIVAYLESNGVSDQFVLMDRSDTQWLWEFFYCIHYRNVIFQSTTKITIHKVLPAIDYLHSMTHPRFETMKDLAVSKKYTSYLTSQLKQSLQNTGKSASDYEIQTTVESKMKKAVAARDLLNSRQQPNSFAFQIRALIKKEFFQRPQ